MPPKAKRKKKEVKESKEEKKEVRDEEKKESKRMSILDKIEAGIIDIRKCTKSPKDGGLSPQDIKQLVFELDLEESEDRPAQSESKKGTRKKRPSKQTLCLRIMSTILARQFPPAPRAVSNSEIAALIKQLAATKKGYDEWAWRALVKGAEAIRKFPSPITFPAQNQLEDVEGVGWGVLWRVNEILQHGALHELQPKSEEKKSHTDYLRELTDIHGVGKVKANEWIRLGIKSVDEARDKVIDPTWRKRMNPSSAQLIGLQWYDELRQPVPREVSSRIGSFIIQRAKKLDGDTRGQITGSYRRGKAQSGDIDILLTNDLLQTEKQIEDQEEPHLLQRLWEDLMDLDLVEHKLGGGRFSFHGTFWMNWPYVGSKQLAERIAHGKPLSESEQKLIEALGGLQSSIGPRGLRKIDISLVPSKSWGAALLHTTGGAGHNNIMQELAKKKNMHLSKGGLFEYNPATEKIGALIPTYSEESIFRMLGIPYVEPKDRNA